MAEAPDEVLAPSAGIWRVGRNPNPLLVKRPRARDLRTRRAGNRFDIAGVPIVYFATELQACFAETLARLRPDPKLRELVEDEWFAAHRFRPSWVSQGWRLRRTAVRVKVEPRPFLDVTTMGSLLALREELALGLAALGYHDLDLGLVQGPDRRVTRLIAAWAYHQEQDDAGSITHRYAGIKYTSRLNHDWACWAVFPETDFEEIEAKPIDREMPELLEIAEKFGLRVF